MSQPGFLANFEDDDTLLSTPSLRQLDPSVLRTISGTADADTKLDEAAEKQQDRDPTVVRAETSGTAPTHTIDELALAPEYSENVSFGGPILSVVLMTVLVALAIGVDHPNLTPCSGDRYEALRRADLCCVHLNRLR